MPLHQWRIEWLHRNRASGSPKTGLWNGYGNRKRLHLRRTWLGSMFEEGGRGGRYTGKVIPKVSPFKWAKGELLDEVSTMKGLWSFVCKGKETPSSSWLRDYSPILVSSLFQLRNMSELVEFRSGFAARIFHGVVRGELANSSNKCRKYIHFAFQYLVALRCMYLDTIDDLYGIYLCLN